MNNTLNNVIFCLSTSFGDFILSSYRFIPLLNFHNEVFVICQFMEISCCKLIHFLIYENSISIILKMWLCDYFITEGFIRQVDSNNLKLKCFEY